MEELKCLSTPPPFRQVRKISVDFFSLLEKEVQKDIWKRIESSKKKYENADIVITSEDYVCQGRSTYK